ncbi:MAG: HlyD family secretion protein, partial [Gammaproteobacteria bacterium]
PLFVILIVLMSGSAGIYYWFKWIHPFESTDNAYLKAYMSLISPKETGYVKEVLFEDNQKVMTGDVIVVLDDHDYRARVAHAEAQVLLETASIQALEIEKKAQNAKIRQEQANIAASEAAVEKSIKDLRRFQNLAAEGAVSEQTRDAAVSAAKQAKAEHDKYVSARQEAESRQSALDARIDETRARLKAAQADLELARIDLDNTRIAAPFEGIIGNRSVQVGQLVQPGTVLAYLIPVKGIFVEANFKETQIADMSVGQSVEILVDAVSNRRFEGIVESFAPASGSEFSLLPPENATGNFTKIVRRVPVKIGLMPDDDLGRLRPGLSSTVRVRVR